MDKEINLIIGATGRIGYPLCLELKARGKYVRALCRKSSPVTPLVAKIADEVVYGDLLDADSLVTACKNVDIVYHLAALVSIESKITDILADTNINGTQNVIDACKVNKVRRLVYTSSTDTLSDKITDGYAKTKLAAGRLVSDAIKDGLDAVIAYPSAVIGPYEYKLSNVGQMIADCIDKKMKFYIKGNYDFVDVRDICKALCDLADVGRSGENYILNGHKTTVKKILDMIADMVKVKRPKIKIPLFVAKFFAPGMERRKLKKGLPPTVTPYSLRVLQSACDFSHKNVTALTGYSPRPLSEAFSDQIDFYLNKIKNKK